MTVPLLLFSMGTMACVMLELDCRAAQMDVKEACGCRSAVSRKYSSAACA